MVGMLHEARGRRDAAIAEYERVLSHSPRAGVAANNLAWIRIQQDKLDDAVRLASMAVEAMKDRPEPHDTLGWAYYHQGSSTRAISSFERALALMPDNATYHYHLGLAYVQLGNDDRARAALTRALELKPEATIAADARRVLAETGADR
jgi:cellulose synthase operon protein C